MTGSILFAVLGLLATLGVAFWLFHRRQDTAAFAAVVAAPLVGALLYVMPGALQGKSTAPAPVADQPAAPEAAPAGPVAASDAGGATAAAPAAPAAASAGGGAIDGLRRDAEEMRRNKRFAEARDLYAKITQMAPFDADAWADLGDAAAAAAGGDLKAGVQSIDRALELDPKHAKALWLKASLELQEKRYQKAADLWQRLLEQLPKDSNDARIVAANLEETRSLAARQGAKR